MTGLGTVEFQSTLDTDTGDILAVNILTADPFVTFHADTIIDVYMEGGRRDGPAGAGFRLENVPPKGQWSRVPWGWKDQFLGALLYIETTDAPPVIYRLGQLYYDRPTSPDLVIDGHWPD